MKDIKGQEVNIGDRVYIAHGKLLYEAVFSKETKNSFIIKLSGATRGYSIPKTISVWNNKWDGNKYWAARNGNVPYTVPKYIITDISQEPCKRIIKID